MKPNCQIPDCPDKGHSTRRYPIPVGPGLWVEQGAACRGLDPETWFPVTERPPATDLALATCHTCPVLDACRDWAIDNQPYGIAGGLTTSQRETRRRNRKTVGAR